MSSYATPTDLFNLTLPAGALPPWIDATKQQAMLDTCSDLVDSYIGAKFRLPLTSVTTSIKLAVCALAAYKLLILRGYNPEAGKDMSIKEAHDQALDWLERIAKGTVSPPELDSSQGGVIGGPYTAQMSTTPNGQMGPNFNTPSSTVATGDGTSVSIGTPTSRGWY